MAKISIRFSTPCLILVSLAQNVFQPTADPIAHFKATPWCAALLAEKAVVQTMVPDCTPIASTESALVREVLSTPDTVKACVTFFHYIKPTAPSSETGEDKKNPFLQLCALLDVGSGINGYAKRAHGGIFGVMLDEVMGTAANMQAEHGAFTVSLTIKFKKPLYTPSIVLVRGKVVKKEGQKLSLRGTFEDKDGNIIAESEGTWIRVNRDTGRSNLPKAKL